MKTKIQTSFKNLFPSLSILSFMLTVSASVWLLQNRQQPDLSETTKYLSENIAFPFEVEAEEMEAKQKEAEIAFLEKRISKTKKASAIDRAALGHLYLWKARRENDDERVEKARALAEKALADIEKLPSALSLLIDIHDLKHEFKDSISMAREVLKENPRSSVAYANIVTGSLALGDLPMALQTAQTWVQIAESVSSLTHRGLVFAHQGEFEKAFQDFNRALRLENAATPASEAYFLRMKMSQILIQRKAFEEAGRLVEVALQIRPQSSTTLGLQAEILEKRDGAFQKAAEKFEAAFEIANQESFLIDAARNWLKAGYPERAKLNFSKAESILRGDMEAGRVGHRMDLARLLMERAEANDLIESEALSQIELKGGRRGLKTYQTYAKLLQKLGKTNELETLLAEKPGLRL